MRPACTSDLGVGLRLFNILKQDCKEIDLRIPLEAEESARSESEQEVVDLHKRAGKLDAEETELFDEAEQHQN